MSAQQVPPQTTEERLKHIEEQVRVLSYVQPYSPVTSFLEKWLPGITLLTIIGFSFWLGTLSSTIKQTSDKVDKVYSQVLESKDSLTARTSVVEAKLEVMDKKLDQIIAAQK